MASFAAQTETPAQTHNAKTMANAIRALAMDAVEKAQSGHPGMPMGMADVATVLFTKFLKFDATAPEWADRDRFILSAGHGSMLLYALLYLTGYEKISLDQIKNFRQLHALTAGHPEVMQDAGIEMTTGPLGQGISTAVGFALAERHLNAKYGDALVNHKTYVIASDGDLMEGISHEACSLAGHLKLNNLVVLYDDNGISIDGETSLSFSDNTVQRFESYGWQTLTVDGHDHTAIEAALIEAQEAKKPMLIACKTHIGFGAPTKQDKSSSHGSPLGTEELAGTKKALGWAHGPFEIPEEILNEWRSIGVKGQTDRMAWEKQRENSPLKNEFEAQITCDLSALEPTIKNIIEGAVNEPTSPATRKASGNVLDVIVDELPWLIGGSADLTGSNNTYKKGNPILSDKNYGGQYIHYGVREHGIAAIMNGMTLHGGIIPYSGTFLSFADYCRPSIRLAALMKQRVIHVMTHDSIGLGEDGPTHQPVEHLASLRAIPNTYVFRPCDQVETAECWQAAIELNHSPSIMALTRQGLPQQRLKVEDSNLSAKGAYVILECDGEADVTLFATGSEVHLATDAAKQLGETGKSVRVVSIPCMDLFMEQDDTYKQSVIGNAPKKIAVEAAIRQGWDQIIGSDGIFIGMSSFGESAPAEELYTYFGITVDAIINAAMNS